MYKPSEVTNRTEKIGDTLFINGVPHTECGVCGDVIKKFDGMRTVIAGRDKRTVLVKEFKVQVGHWVDVKLDPPEDDHGDVKYFKRIPFVRSVNACERCYNLQHDQRANEKHLERTVMGYKPRLVMFSDKGE